MANDIMMDVQMRKERSHDETGNKRVCGRSHPVFYSIWSLKRRKNKVWMLQSYLEEGTK